LVAGAGAWPALPPATKAVAYTVLFDVDNEDAELMPQMTAQVVFVTGQAAQALTVPLMAVADKAGTTDKAEKAENAEKAEKAGSTQTVRVLDAKGQPEQRTVRLGVRSRHQAEVLEGLQEGERVIVGETPLDRGPRWLQW